MKSSMRFGIWVDLHMEAEITRPDGSARRRIATVTAALALKPQSAGANARC
jgi:hypothetical protein